MPLHLKSLSSMVKTKGVKGYLHKHLPQIDEHRGYNPLHASDLTNQSQEFCPRCACLLMEEDGAYPHEVIKTSLSYTFLIGRLIERELRNNWLRKIAWGDWECTLCGHTQKRVFNAHCSGCGADSEYMEYQETQFEMTWGSYGMESLAKKEDEFVLSCSPDVFVKLPGRPKNTLVEIKTLDKDQFKSLAAPLAEHRIRTILYMHIIEKSSYITNGYKDEIDLERASLLYVSKGFGIKDESLGPLDGGFTPFKEYEIERDDGVIKPYLHKVSEILEYRSTKILPNRICSMPTNKRAKYCPAKDKCFASDI